jgi:proline iminopeptidase
MHALYPAIKPYAQHELNVGNNHVLYVEETGSPHGIPVVVLHSGPGSASDCYMRRFFDPQRYRIIVFDQRGCGHSTPHLMISDNNTELLYRCFKRILKFVRVCFVWRRLGFLIGFVVC